MKRCTKCGKKKRNTSFYWSDKVKGIRRSECKKCEGISYSIWWKSATTEERKRKYSASMACASRRADENIAWLAEYLKKHSCIVCGEKNILMLEFHHRRRSRKKYDISALAGQGKSLKLLIKEVAKCDVICANDHRVETAYQRKYRILKFL